MIQKIVFIALMVLIIILGVVAHYVHWNPFNPLHGARLTVDNLSREFTYYVPKGLSDHPGLLFVLHGSEMTSAEMRYVTGRQFDRFADKYRDFIVVYPQGFHRYWNDCRRMVFSDAQRLNVNDVGFFSSMAGFFSDKYSIDTSRLFAVGYSNGGQMCYRLAKEIPGMLRGIAVLCASLPLAANDHCSDIGRPVSILVMNGTADPINPYDGGEVRAGSGEARGEVVSTVQTLEFWLDRDSCERASRVEYEFPDLKRKDSSTVIQYSYTSHRTQKQVALVKIINGGHTIPNPGFSFWTKALGNVNKDVNAPEIIVKFFRQLQ